MIIRKFFFFFFLYFIRSKDNNLVNKNDNNLYKCPQKSLNNYPLVIKCLELITELKIINQSNERYQKLNYQWNLFKPKVPIAYILINSIKIMRKALECCRKFNYPISIRAGGHSYEKYSFGEKNAIVLDLKGLNKMSIDKASNTATVQAGLLLGKVYYNLWNGGKYGIPGGSCPLIGISGHTLGGGYGLTSRKWGLLIDRVLEFEIMDVNGNMLRANTNYNSDLFWALKGAGQGSFGIVTKFKYELFKASDLITVITIKSNFKEAFDNFQKWSVTDPSNSVTAILYANYELIASINFVIQGEEKDKIISNIKLYFKNFSELIEKQMSFIEMILYFSNNKFIQKIEDLNKVNSHMIDQTYFHAKSHFVKRLLTSEEINILLLSLSKFKTGYVLFDVFGGKIAQIKQKDTAFVHRNGIIYSVQSCHDSKIADLSNLNDFDKNTSFMHSNESYQNYIDESLDNALQKYYGNNLGRLRIIKRKYDPENYFCFPLSIPL